MKTFVKSHTNMLYLSELVLFTTCILLTQYSVQGTIYSCNTTAPCGCSQNKVNINSRIVGGETAASHSWAWAVSLRKPSVGHFCGGTIISPHYILTAAHCLEGVSLSRITITAAVGTDTLYDSEGQRVIASNIYMHPRWNTVTKENDIAIIKLKNAISFGGSNIAKLCLPAISVFDATSFPSPNTNLVAIGWGSTITGGSSSNVLRQVTVQSVSDQVQKCSNSIHNVDLQFCAAVNGGGKDTCQGDSGGPLMYYSPVYQQWMIAGITSYGRGCGLSGYAGVYARASVYISWIKQIVGADGVVIAGEDDVVTPGGNTANIGSMSSIFSMMMLAFLFLIRSF
ncbi:unnamed protein product [Adineta steineri]|uniref:Peptidase S1 domain-containing protein n=1 Tax=Adineta steineri TaxID=433720 RepID=A0A815L5E6_9BILA|nr:unnamed protein product [Adineta steineri]CAF3794094.1 unnamed protein product [Adineta steineri]